MASESASLDSVFLEDFGQKVDLTRRIREVLLNYPEGTTVLKELVQNADDAGATKVCLCLDRRVHGRESLLSESLAPFQGPALLAYNNAVFTEEDFVSISRIGGSNKHGQAWKTGRFGVGFNSVYHLTELPSFVSGKYVVMFDPQGIYLPKVSAANPGKRIDFIRSSAISQYRDQFLPYCVFNCDMKSSFAGTLFRLPLRNADLAARSNISRQAYTEEDISSMFAELYEEGVLTLLFLKSVLCIEMFVWNDGETEPQKLYSFSVRSASSDIIWHRQMLLRLSKSTASTMSDTDSYSLEFLSRAMSGTQIEERIDSFFIVQTMASATSRIGSFAATASKEYDIHLLPWASLAVCTSDDSSNNSVLKLGRAFCFLPLPVKTGLTVQVNGFFEVSSNRRGIWYGADMDRSGKIRSIWNRLLLEDIIAPSFIELLIGVQVFLGPTDAYFSLWPSGSFEEPWNILVEQVYKNIGNALVLYSNVEGGKWVSPNEAFLHDDKFARSTELGEALVRLGMPIVHLPENLSNMLLKFCCTFQQKVVTPCTVRQFLRDCKHVSTLNRPYKLVLLEYCIEDLIDADVCTHAFGLPLLPLANGDFGLFSEASKGISYFICDELEYKLLHQISDRVIDWNIPLAISARLSNIARSSTSNLFAFNVHYFLQLFPKFVPADWKYKNEVFWDPESCSNHPTSSWFLLFWQYLRDHCEKLSLFSDWPILPCKSRYLYRASKQSKVINVQMLSNEMQNILSKLGCKLLDPYYKVEHRDLFHYVNDGNCTGILDSIYDAISSTGGLLLTSLHNLEVEEKDGLRRFLLDPKWYLGGSMKDNELEKCKRLPIFKVYNGGSAQDFGFSDLESPRKYFPPSDVGECFLGVEFIFSSSDDGEEEILLKYYGIKKMGKASFYRKHVLNQVGQLQPKLRDNTMLSVLLNLPQLCVEDVTFRECLSNLDFIPTSRGTLKCPAALYDPRYEELCALLDDFDSFPSTPFNESYILDILQGLGLRTCVSPETIVQSALHVERFMHMDQNKAHSRGKVLLSYLEVNAIKWLLNPTNEEHGMVNRLFSTAATAFRPRNFTSDLEKFWNDLRKISWCPVLLTPPFETLPWPIVSSMVAPPKLVRLPKDLWLVSASMRILDGECSSSALAHSLGWSSSPSGSIIAAQLLELGKNNEIVHDLVLRKELAQAMPRIYALLTGLIGSDEMDVVKAVLEGCRWIWVGDGFATSEEVVLDGPLHLAPYIRVIPIDLAVFKELFLKLGIREFLKPNDYADILSRMAIRKGSSSLNTQEVRAAILIVQHLAEAQLPKQQINLYLPDISCRLLPASNLVYNDAPWLLGTDDTDVSFNGESTFVLNARKTVQNFVHGNISNEVAEKLGVCSLRRILLAESADSMNLSLSGAAEAFGQHEALTNRLRHILEMYADGSGILFELIQNAEDAGASEVVFLLDKTHYGTSSILSPEMADWQGPALYCYNDSVFSSHDLYAISRVGQESKLQKPLSIGRFGLGFNCVYHFTDIPTFVSGENVVMFDPHACNLPGISPSHPGLRIKYAGRRILEQFPDQFSPYLHFGCDMQKPFPGTLFRFPLRSPALASRSEIKKEAYAPEDVLSLFYSFSEVASDALLFLTNVKTISIFTKDDIGHEMQCLYRVHKNTISEPSTESSAQQDIINFICGNRQGELDREQFLRKLNKSISKDLPYKCQKHIITEKSSGGDILQHYWITSGCLGGGLPRNNSGVGDKSYNFIPWACVAALLHSVKVDEEMNYDQEAENNWLIASDSVQVSSASIQGRKPLEGRAFCFLPLPIKTGLPVHVNAYFELSSNRRDIWYGDDMAGGGKKRSEWNSYLLENVVAPAYGHLLEKIASEIGHSGLFSSFWPSTAGLEPWGSVVRNLYSFIGDFGILVLYTNARGGQWISARQAIFPDFSFDKVHELIEALSDSGLPLISTSKSIVDRFMEVCPSLHFLTPHLLRTLLIKRKRAFKDRKATILTLEYCLVDLKLPFQSESLCRLPLLPLADGTFTTFNKNGMGERTYIARGDEYGILKESVPSQLVDPDIPEAVHAKLCEVAQTEDLNICFLSCHLLEKLFLRFLPTEWQNARQVNWNPGHQSHPSLEWIRLVWCYLKLHCNDLSQFSKWPILPVGENSLLQLVENSNVLRADGWSENMFSLLLKVGCLFLRRDMPIEHPQLENFVHPSTATGILNAFLAIAGDIENVEGLFHDACEGELHELRSFILQSKWFLEGNMEATHVDIIKRIPMFESYKSRKLVSLSQPVRWIKPTGLYEDFLNDDFVRIESEKERIILKRYFGIGEPSRVEFYKDYVLNHMSEFLSEREALSTILLDVKLLIEEDASLKSSVSMIPFVLTGNGSWQPPSRLYDPRVHELKNMLHEETFFPSEIFSDDDILDALVSLGLNRSLGLTGFLDCARSVPLLNDSENSYARRLFVCLDALAHKLSINVEGNCYELQTSTLVESDYVDDDTSMEVGSLNREDTSDMGIDSLIGNLTGDESEEEFWSEMKTIAWCPVCADSPVKVLPWLKTCNKVAPPSIVRPKSQMCMVSSSMHILDGVLPSVYLQHKLGWTDCPRVEVLCAQLTDISKLYGELRLHSSLEPDINTALQEGITILYSKLQEYRGTDDFVLLKSALNGVSWVWVGDDFVSPSALAFDSPVKFSPYLYVVPSELSEFRDLLSELGVRLSFNVKDYLDVLQRLHKDVKGSPLSTDQMNFVICVLEAILDCCMDKPEFTATSIPLLIPNSSQVLMLANDLVYNDAPWMEENNILVGKHFVHPSISHDLASRLGVQSIRCLSLVDEEMTKDLPCMEYAKISELLKLYGDDYLFFDLLELADCCRAKKLRLIFDKREHPRQSLLQHNLGEFQGPALVAIFEGSSLSTEEISGLQFRPPWKLRGDTLNYGLGLLSCYYVCDLLYIISGGYFYIFDPRGIALSVAPKSAPGAKMFSLIGSNLIERFKDQFHPLLGGQNMSWPSDSTIIRMPLSSACLKDGLESGIERIKEISSKFLDHASRSLLFLKSVLQVSFSTWDQGGLNPYQDYSACVNLSSAIARNPFSEKKWKKFQLSRLFSSSNAATKVHAIDVILFQGDAQFVDRWLVVLSLGSGQTRNMALDRRYLAYNLTPVAGLAAHISRNGLPADIYLKSPLMAPFPLSGDIILPVTVLGCFLVCHNGGRYLFKNQVLEAFVEPLDAGNKLVEAWNRELMSCVCDSYIFMVLEIHKQRKESSSSALESNVTHSISSSLKAYGNQVYSFWPRSGNGSDSDLDRGLKADWECLVEQVIRPFYARAIDLPVWQLYSGNLVKAEEGMFLAQPGSPVGDNLLPATVCGFVKEHYPVFSVPWELIKEIQAVGITVRQIRPKMVRDLLRVSSASIVLQSIDTYLDVLEYCLSDIVLATSSNHAEDSIGADSINTNPGGRSTNTTEDGPTSIPVSSVHSFARSSNQNGASSGDALEMMTSLGRALLDFGRGVVEDIGRSGESSFHSNTFNGRNNSYRNVDQHFLQMVSELKGLPFPTASNNLVRLGSMELWLGSKDQQELMIPLAAKFLHPKIFDRSILGNILTNDALHKFLKLQKFSLNLLATHMRSVFHANWVNHVMNSNMAPWFSWDNKLSSGVEEGPTSEWIRIFWKNFSGTSQDLLLFSDWPLIPAFLGRPILCRVRERHLVFLPPVAHSVSPNSILEIGAGGSDVAETSLSDISKPESLQPYTLAFQRFQDMYPWLFPLLNHCNIPIFDVAFMDCAALCNCVPNSGQPLGQVIASKFVAAKNAGYFPELASLSDSNSDELLKLFAKDFASNGTNYGREELEILRTLPIYRTVVGSYTQLRENDQCMISSNSFLKPNNECCLSYSSNSMEYSLLRALRVPELDDEQILIKFGFPGYDCKPQSEQEDILIYLYTNWRDLQANARLVECLSETKFVRSADEFCTDLFKSKELYDPSDALLTSVFSDERKKFPGERFAADGWLHILRKVGLRTTAEANVILECAKKVETLGSEWRKSEEDGFEFDLTNAQSEVPMEIWTLAGSVVEAVFSNFAVFYSNSFCNALGNIVFVPAELGFPNLGGNKGGKRVLASYSDAIASKDWPLAWSCAPILSKHCVIPPEYSWGALNLKSPPAFPKVLKHLQVIGRNGGEDTLSHWPISVGIMSINEASCEVLKYLERIWSTLSSLDVLELQRVAFIPVANATRLVKANALFARLTINLSPIAFQLPSGYLPFVKILRDLGLQDGLSVASAKDLLSSLQVACGYQRLNPNELRSVMEILHFICDEATEAKIFYGREPEVIVPDDGCRLVHATSCAYIDTYGSRYIKCIDTSRLRFVHPDLPEKICRILGIKKLSELVIEELDHEDSIEPLECIGAVSLGLIKEKLLSRSFQSAVWNVANSMVSYTHTNKNLDLEAVEELLKSFAERLQFVKCLHTRFLLLPNSINITRPSKDSIIPEWEDGRHHRALYFVKQSKTCILVAEPPACISIFDVLAIVVSQILGSPIPLPIGSLFFCPEGIETAIVDILKLCSEKTNEKFTGISSLIGKEILPQDALQIQLHPLRPFYAGEVVAWRSQSGEKLKYGMVLEDVRPSAGQALYRFRVETTSGIIQSLLSSQVLSFRSISIDGGPSSSNLLDSSHMVIDNGSSVQMPENSESGKIRSQPAAELQYGKVSAEELVQAVHEMLTTAGINVDIERQSLLQKTITLQEQLKDSQAALLLEQEKSDAAAKEADTAKAAWVCRVCLTSEVEITIVPCGHVLCRRCSSAVSKCPFCRLKVSKIMRIFRP
ncbi:sacsin isoform X1 [Cucurbita pepo subsp. pepo]|uniref:sacsin isoform X1 n=2 Tax=Cucurbita pepo subsp. pepo TaxID=3664 RepID=UPI000C9D2BC6|nr:sacsin isoform X1 [Cucurbita pepo subsp. pepo]